MSEPEITPPYLLFLGDARGEFTAKTAGGITHWRPERCLGQIRLAGCGTDVGLEEMSIADAAARGARTFVIGVAPHGGALPQDWVAIVVAALEAGLDVASGLHRRLADIPEVAAPFGVTQVLTFAWLQYVRPVNGLPGDSVRLPFLLFDPLIHLRNHVIAKPGPCDPMP